MKDDWNIKDYIVMRYHHMMEEGFYPEDKVEILRQKLQGELARKELTSRRINELFGVIDTEYMKDFWEKRAKEHDLNEALTNLEDNEDLLKLKIKDEESKVLPYVDWGKTILDLGSGWGSWAFKFIDHGAKHVTCVDYVEEMCEKGRDLAERLEIENIDFINSPIQDFCSDEKFDVIFLSAISIYLNDDDYQKMLKNMKGYTKKGTILVLRESTGTPRRHSFDKEYSERLKTLYSGIYRSAEEYENLFKSIGFKLLDSQDMFPEGHPLNRFPKTKLRLYRFMRE